MMTRLFFRLPGALLACAALVAMAGCPGMQQPSTDGEPPEISPAGLVDSIPGANPEPAVVEPIPAVDNPISEEPVATTPTEPAETPPVDGTPTPPVTSDPTEPPALELENSPIPDQTIDPEGFLIASAEIAVQFSVTDQEFVFEFYANALRWDEFLGHLTAYPALSKVRFERWANGAKIGGAVVQELKWTLGTADEAMAMVHIPRNGADRIVGIWREEAWDRRLPDGSLAEPNPIVRTTPFDTSP